MGTTIRVLAPEWEPQLNLFDEAVRSVERTFKRLEDRFTRFRGDSELSRVNARTGQWTTVSEGFIDVLRAALDAALMTGGLFDPTILPALVAAGYDRDFDEIIAGARDAMHPPQPCGRWEEIRIDGRRIHLPEGTALDFGGIAKGWAVDVAAERVARLMPWVLVDGGGDLRVAGVVPKEIDVGIEHPQDPSVEILRLRLNAGALATSSVTSRSWGPNLHQLIDPRTWKPSDTGIVQATAWAPTCAEAEVRSKWVLLGGLDAMDRVHATMVLEDGEVVTNMQPDKTAKVDC